MANSSSPSAACTTALLLLLLAGASATEAPQPNDFPMPGSPIQPISDDILRCWRAIFDFESCTPVAWFPLPLTGRQGKLSPECCQAVGEIIEECTPDKYLPGFSYLPEMLAFVQRICADYPPTLPAPQPAAAA